MASINFERVTKVYDGGTTAVRDLSLDIEDGEFVVLVGPSGCGKTTALRMVAGLEEITSGLLRIGDQVVNELLPRQRDVAMVFQNYALYPHINVASNIAFGLKMRRVPKQEREAKAREAARILGISDLLNRKPRQLSGGQRQRVAMGRAIVRQPKAFLMDEPLSNLDAKLRVQMRGEISRIQRELGTTTLYVTHDQTEAMTMGDRVAVMRRGDLQQLDVPQALYDRPANLFVASFIGSPSMNFLHAEVTSGASGIVVKLENAEIEIAENASSARWLAGRGPVIVGVRAEAVTPHPHDGSAGGIPATVTLVEALGHERLIYVDVGTRAVDHEQVAEAAVVDSDDVEVASELLAQRAIVVARVEHGGSYEVGDRVNLQIDTRGLHFFDAKSGQRIEASERDS